MKGTLITKETGANHVIPLSRQVLALLEELRPYTGHYRLLFPGLRDPANTPMSSETINKALKILGIQGGGGTDGPWLPRPGVDHYE